MKKQLYKRLTACVLALVLVLSFSASAFADTAGITSASLASVPWTFWQKIGELTGDYEDSKDFEEKRSEFIRDYLVRHPDATYYDASEAFRKSFNSGGHHSGGFGGTFPENPTEEEIGIFHKLKDEEMKLLALWLLNHRDNYEEPPAFVEHPIVRSSKGYYTYEQVVNPNYLYFYYAPAGSTKKYSVRYYGFKLRFYDYNGVLQSTRTYCYNLDQCTQHFGAFAEGFDTMIFELSFDSEKNSLVYTYGFRSIGKGYEKNTTYIGLPADTTYTDDDLPKFNPNIPDYYKMPTDDNTNPVYYDPVTNNFYDYTYNIVSPDDFNFSPTDEEKEQFNELYKLIEQFRTAQIAGNINIMQLLTDILSKLNTFDGSGQGTCKDYSEVLDQINAAIVAIAQNTGKTVDLSPIISGLEQLKYAVKEISVPNYSSKLNAAVNNLDSILKKLDTIIALLGVDVATNIFDALTDDESKKLDAFASVAAALLNILPSAVIGSTIVSLQSVFLTNSPPSDLTVTYQGEKITALSADMFSTSTQYIDMFKIFVSALLIYGWLLMMRRRVSDVFT